MFAVFTYMLVLYYLFLYYIGVSPYVATVKRVCTLISKQNIFYVKVLQWFTQTACRDDPELRSFFHGFKNNVAYTDADIDYGTIRHLTNAARKNKDRLTFDSYTPLNSGTVALVFSGTLNDQPVVVKLLRKRIRGRMESMFKTLLLLRFFTRVNIVRILEDVRDNFYTQVDFLREGQNAELFYQKFRLNKNVVIPKVYHAYTGSNVLVMDRLTPRYDQSLWTETDARQFCKLFTQFIVASYFIKDIYHGDLHMGNLVFLKVGDQHRLGVIDFGLVGQLNVTNQNFIYGLFELFQNSCYTAVVALYVDYIFAVNGQTDEELKEKITAELTARMEAAGSTDMGQLSHKHIYILLSVSDYGLTYDKNMHLFLFSLLSMTDTMKALRSDDEKDNSLFHIMNQVNR